jgi:hypothetical protein
VCVPLVPVHVDELLTHTILTTVVWLAALGIVRARSSGKSGWAWAAGLAIGFASLVRPLDALIAAILFGLWAMGLGGKRLRLPSLAALVLGTILMGALAGPYNAYLTGSPSQAPLQVYMDQKFGKGSNDLGFGPNRGSGWPIDAWPGHTPLEAVLNSTLNASSVNTELHGWSIGSLWAVAIAVLAGRGKRTGRIWLGAVVVIVFVYGFYHFSGGPDFGARYWYQALLPLLILSARGLETLSKWVGDERPIAAAILLSVLALGIYLPWRAADKYWHYLYMRPDVREAAARENFDGAWCSSVARSSRITFPPPSTTRWICGRSLRRRRRSTPGIVMPRRAPSCSRCTVIGRSGSWRGRHWPAERIESSRSPWKSRTDERLSHRRSRLYRIAPLRTTAVGRDGGVDHR